MVEKEEVELAPATFLFNRFPTENLVCC